MVSKPYCDCTSIKHKQHDLYLLQMDLDLQSKVPNAKVPSFKNFATIMCCIIIQRNLIDPGQNNCGSRIYIQYPQGKAYTAWRTSHAWRKLWYGFGWYRATICTHTKLIYITNREIEILCRYILHVSTSWYILLRQVLRNKVHNTANRTGRK
jgi:hypothetical protein